MIKNGVFVGRFQPFHKGHAEIVENIINDGLNPILLVGTSIAESERYPFSFSEVKEMCSLVYPKIDIYQLDDCPTDSEWINQVLRLAPPAFTNIYYGRKGVDVQDGAHYVDLLKPSYQIKECEIHKNINARDIRSNIRKHKNLMDGKVYEYLDCR